MFKYLIIFLSFLLCIDAFTAFNCEGNNTKIARFSSTEVYNCPQLHHISFSNKFVQVQILQESMFVPVHYKSCKVKVYYLITYCGAYSYASMMKDGKGTIVEEIKASECAEIHKNLEYYKFGHTIADLKINTTSFSSFTAYGTVDSGGNCQGAAFTFDGINRDHSIMQVEIEISLWSGTAYYNSLSELVEFNAGKTCSSSGKCWLPD